VREALRQLESEGLVVLRPHSGAHVAVLDFEECLDIYKIRERLEPLAFSESVGRLTEAQLDEVARAAAEVELLTADHAAWLAADRAFHLACYAGVSTPRILRMIVGFWNTTQHYRRVLLTTFIAHDFELAHDEHRLMVDALVHGDARRGEDMVRMAMERSRLRLSRHRDLFDR
jgi:DNA-binding GntR family transcriptional regulator